MVQASRLRSGSVVLMNGDLCKVLSVTHLTPGNLRAMVQAKLRNLRSGLQFENRFRSTEDVEQAHLDTRKMEYLYNDENHFHFMDSETYEQITMDSEMIGDSKDFLLPNTQVDVTFYENKPIGIELPTTVNLKVVEAEPAVKRQTASSSYKRCTVETGLKVMVPPFVNSGDVIKVNTETGEYMERA